MTVEGHLDWQNAINSHNTAFGDVCNGIFINYTWNRDHLHSSDCFLQERRDAYEKASGARLPVQQVTLKNPYTLKNNHQIYFGIDVFGRGSYGGGGWRCGVANAELLRLGFSAALFAPGWLLESQNLAMSSLPLFLMFLCDRIMTNFFKYIRVLITIGGVLGFWGYSLAHKNIFLRHESQRACFDFQWCWWL